MIRLLVVDDSALVRRVFGQIFSREDDLTVAFARNGAEALEMLASFAPDVVTLDIQMPVMDGLECLDRIMVEHPVPVLMVSAITSADATVEALRLGAVDFIQKPAGAISLRIDELAPRLVAAVRTAATTRPRAALRLRDRIRYRLRGRIGDAQNAPKVRIAPPPAAAVGDGVVLMACSTGGPSALEVVLSGLPGDFPWPIVVAQHMPSGFTGSLARRLDGLCALRVAEVAQTETLETQTVYIARGDSDVVIVRRGGRLAAQSVAPLADYPWHPSADRLVRSAMEQLAPRQLVGVLMTGMGYDGAAAMTELHRAGGRTIAEAEETAVVWGMPGELARAGGADWVLPLPRIPERLRELAP